MVDRANSADCQKCACYCSKHPPCDGHVGQELVNDLILGNHWENIGTRQECCNMCTNHPKCDTFTFVDAAAEADRRCVLYAGSPKWKLMAPGDATYKNTYSGCQSGVSEADC